MGFSHFQASQWISLWLHISSLPLCCESQLCTHQQHRQKTVISGCQQEPCLAADLQPLPLRCQCWLLSCWLWMFTAKLLSGKKRLPTYGNKTNKQIYLWLHTSGLTFSVCDCLHRSCSKVGIVCTFCHQWVRKRGKDHRMLKMLRLQKNSLPLWCKFGAMTVGETAPRSNQWILWFTISALSWINSWVHLVAPYRLSADHYVKFDCWLAGLQDKPDPWCLLILAPCLSTAVVLWESCHWRQPILTSQSWTVLLLITSCISTLPPCCESPVICL